MHLNILLNLKKEVVPGDRLDISSEVISWKRGIAIGKAICTVDNIEVSSANMKITIPEILNSFLPK